MEKTHYKAYREALAKVEAGTANFHERLLIKIVKKKKAKGLKLTFSTKT